MEELYLEGFFWLEATPDDEVAGRLTFDAVNGAELDLIGSFHPLQESFDELEHPIRIHGIAGGKLFTLIGCLRTNTSMQMPGIARERYRASIVLRGCQMNESQPLEFDAVRLRFCHLDSWVARTGTVIDYIRDEQSTVIEKIQVTHRPLEKEVAPTDIGQVELIFTYGIYSDPFHTTTLTQSVKLGVQFSKPLSLQNTFEVCTALRNLVTIGVDAPASITEVSLSHSGVTWESSDGKAWPLPIGLYTKGLGDHTQGEVKKIYPRQMLFTLDDIGGLNGITQWLKVSEKYKAVIGSLLSHWYLPTIYTDNRFLNIIIAAEALVRIRLQKQRVDFRKGLERLADDAGAPFESLVQDVEPWVNEIRDARVNNLVHRGLYGDLEGIRMFWLSESVYFLVILCLLKECGLAESTLSNITRHQRFRMIAEQLQNTK